MISRNTCLLLLLLFILLSMAPIPGRAQEPAGSLAELALDIWPDYDRPEVLFLLTGRVTSETTLPASVTIPLPPEATLNAVARITGDNLMIDDIEFTEGAESVTLTTPDARFRVEFYMPYSSDGAERQFTYRWQTGDLRVDQLIATIQQPANADGLTVEPEAETISVGSDGLTYHNMPVVAVPAGDLYRLDVSYTTNSDALTVETLQTADPPPAVVDPPTDPSSTDINWPFLLAGGAGVFVLLMVGWLVLQNRRNQPSQPTNRKTAGKKPKPARQRVTSPAKPEKVSFCHQCGQRAQPDDKFCRYCGTQLKNAAS